MDNPSTFQYQVGDIVEVIDGGGSVISTGVQGYISIPFAGIIQSATIIADQSGAAKDSTITAIRIG